MSPEERQLLTALFDRVRTASATPRDREAETLIDQATREQPYSTYYLAQAVIIQEKGLEAAAARIRELEDRVHQLESEDSSHHQAEQNGGFLSSIFGSGQSPSPQQPQAGSRQDGGPRPGPWGSGDRQGNPSARNQPSQYQPNQYQSAQPSQPRGYDDGYRSPQPAGGPWGQQAMPSAGGSFLGGALGTAAGVAGGMLLANSLSGIFGSHMSSLGLGSPLAGANPLGGTTPAAPVEETVVNNYYGDDAIREASDRNPDGNDRPDNNVQNDNAPDNDGWQQADLGNDDQFDADSFGSDDNMNV